MRVSDGFRDLIGGMSSGLEPSLIRPNQAALLVNASVRGGLTTNRPIFKPIRVDGAIVTVGNSDIVQGLDSYSPPNGSLPNLFAFVGGRIYNINIQNFSVVDQTIPGDSNASNLPQCWMKQGEQYFFIQDGQSRPLIYNGSTWRRARKYEAPDYEMPVGTAMEYAFGRMLVARGRNWVAGDIVNGGTEIYQFIENTFLNEGGAFNVPIPGLITAIKAMTSLDNSIGQGPVTIHTPNGIVTARVDWPRNLWKTNTTPFQQVANQLNGSTSQVSCVVVNGDLWFRATDGWRSLILARRDFGGSFGNVPQSFEMKSVMVFDDPKFLRYSQAVLYQNWLVGTSWPTPYESSAYHKGMVGLDFAALGSVNNPVPPAWDGLWTGINPTAMTKVLVNNKERVFIISRNLATGLNELWELISDGDFDNGDGRIEWKFETASMFFPQQANPHITPDRQMKKLFGAEIYIQDVKGMVDFSVEYRSDQYPCWLPWAEFQVCNTYRNCDNADDCSIPQPYRPGFRSPIRLPQPPDTCQQGGTDTKGGPSVPARLGMQFQARVTVTGHCKISKMFLIAETMEQATYTPNISCTVN